MHCDHYLFHGTVKDLMGTNKRRDHIMTTQAHILKTAAQRRAKIASLYAKGLTLRQIAETYNISIQRVSEIIKRYETEKDVTLEHKNKSLPKVIWHCKDCGVERLYLPSRAKEQKRCKTCFLTFLHGNENNVAIPNSMIEEWIAQRLNGVTWKQIANENGYTRPNSLQISIFAYLRRKGRTAEAPKIWKGYSTRWMIRHFPTYARLLGKSKTDGRSLRPIRPSRKNQGRSLQPSPAS